MWLAVGGAGAGGAGCVTGGMTTDGVVEVPVCVVDTDGVGGVGRPPPTPKGIVDEPATGLALALRLAKSGRLVVKDGWCVERGFVIEGTELALLAVNVGVVPNGNKEWLLLCGVTP